MNKSMNRNSTMA